MNTLIVCDAHHSRGCLRLLVRQINHLRRRRAPVRKPRLEARAREPCRDMAQGGNELDEEGARDRGGPEGVHNSLDHVHDFLGRLVRLHVGYVYSVHRAQYNACEGAAGVLSAVSPTFDRRRGARAAGCSLVRVSFEARGVVQEPLEELDGLTVLGVVVDGEHARVEVLPKETTVPPPLRAISLHREVPRPPDATDI